MCCDIHISTHISIHTSTLDIYKYPPPDRHTMTSSRSRGVVMTTAVYLADKPRENAGLSWQQYISCWQTRHTSNLPAVSLPVNSISYTWWSFSVRFRYSLTCHTYIVVFTFSFFGVWFWVCLASWFSIFLNSYARLSAIVLEHILAKL